jgi:hypothetical protein
MKQILTAGFLFYFDDPMLAQVWRVDFAAKSTCALDG